MGSFTTDEILHSRVSVLTGTAGETAATVWGHIPGDMSVVVTAEREEGEYRGMGRDLPLRKWHYYRDFRITVPTLQVSVDNLALASGLTKSGTVLTFGDPSVTLLKPQISVSLTGYNLAGDYTRVTLPYASASGEVVLDANKKTATILNAMFTAEDGTTYPTIDTDGGTSEVTIADGEFERTAGVGVFVVAGEGAAADDLDDITGDDDLTDGEVIRLIPASASYAITIKYVVDVIELFGEADFAMGGSASALNDYVDLKYNSTDGAWHEIGRYDASGAAFDAA